MVLKYRLKVDFHLYLPVNYQQPSLEHVAVTWVRAETATKTGVLLKKVFLKLLVKLTGKHLCQSLFFNRVAGLRRNFLQNTSGGCFSKCSKRCEECGDAYEKMMEIEAGIFGGREDMMPWIRQFLEHWKMIWKMFYFVEIILDKNSLG